jgi:hypothetical protein
MESSADVLDYTRSFIVGRWPHNRVRLAIESRTRFIDDRRGVTEDYYQCASCKSEYTFAKEDLFQDDNFDFLPIFGPEFGVIFRRKAWLNPNYKSVQRVSEMWEGPLYDGVRRAKSCRELSLDDSAAIADATLGNLSLVGRTEVINEATRQRVIYEYPVKTMNINRDNGWYQTDTGPIAFIDVSTPVGRAADSISLAYSAFNAPHFTDFVIECPTPATQPRTSATEPPVLVNHYSKRVSLAARNRLFVIDEA